MKTSVQFYAGLKKPGFYFEKEIDIFGVSFIGMAKMNHYSPRMRPELKWGDLLLDALVLAMIVGIWALAFLAYMHLPDSIALHFDAAGQPNRYGGKANVFLMPFIATLIASGIFIINQFPHIFNYPVKITPQNAIYQYSLATRFMRWTNLLITLLLGIITYEIVASARGKFSKIGIVLIIVYSMLMMIPFVIYLILAFRRREK